MIPKRYIAEWKEFTPWHNDAQIEQDLIIERVLIAIFSDNFLRKKLAFRGGTALHKIYLKPQARYSEDIDLVQMKKGSIGAILDRIKEVIDFFEIKPKVKIKANNNNVIFRFNSEIQPIIPLRLKIEINCREHFSILGYKDIDFQKLLLCYHGYMNSTDNKSPSSREFILNMEKKIQETEFAGDIYGLLRPDIKYDNLIAYQLIKSKLLEHI